MKKLKLLILGCLTAFSALAQKPDLTRSPNGPNTIVDWNVKFKTMIAPHGSALSLAGAQDSTGHLRVMYNGSTYGLYYYIKPSSGAGFWVKAGGSVIDTTHFIYNQFSIRQPASFNMNGAGGANYFSTYDPASYGNNRSTLLPIGLSFGYVDGVKFAILKNDTTTEISNSNYPVKVISGNPFRVENTPTVPTDVVRLQDIGGAIIDSNTFIKNQLSAPQTGTNFWIDGEGVIGDVSGGLTELSPGQITTRNTDFGTYTINDQTGLSTRKISDNVELFGINTTLTDTTRAQGIKPIQFQNKVYANEVPTEPKQLVRLQDLPGGIIGGSLPISDTSKFARKLLQYGATVTTPPAGYGQLSLNSNGSFVVNKASGKNRTWASTYNGSAIMYSPYKATSILADSTDVANKITFGSPTYTQYNLMVAVWGDSMTRGTGSPNAPYTGTFLSYLGLLSNYTFYNGGVNGQTSAQIKVRALADTAKRHWKLIVWAGRNDITGGLSTAAALANVQGIVSNSDNPNYLVIGTVYKQSEIIGTAARDTVIKYNNMQAAAFPGHYFDPNPALIAAYNPSLPQDVIDHGNGVYPTSLGSGDGTHLNSAGQLVNANEVYKYFRYLYTDRKYISSENIAAALDKPTPIGNSMPNSGSFTTLSATDTVTSNTQNNTSVVNISRSGSFINSGQVFTYGANINNSSTLASGGGSIYNVGLLVNASNGAAGAGNIGAWFQSGSLILGPLTSGFASNKLDVQGLSRFGVTGAVNGDMTVANTLTVNQGTGGTAVLKSNSTGSSGTAFLRIGNTATSGISWGFRLGGNTANASGGIGINEGNLGLYDETNSKLAIHVQKSTTNIGIHGVSNATAQLQFAAGTAAVRTQPIKFGPNGVVATTPEANVIEATNTKLFYTDTAATVKTRREILFGDAVQNVRNKVNDPTNTFQTATGTAADSLVFSAGQKLVKKAIVQGTGVVLTQTATTFTIAAASRSHTIFTPTTGATVTSVNNQDNIINPAGTLATLTIALPASPVNNDKVYITFTQAVTALTYSGGTTVGVPASATLGSQWFLTYDTGTATWY